MLTLINASPKPNGGNSGYFLNNISKFFENYDAFSLKKDNYNDILNSFKNSEIIVLAFPLYADSPNSNILKFLDYLVDKKKTLNNKKVYAIINCGFREGEHNIIAAHIIKIWCKKVGAIYCGSILIGAGEIVGNKNFHFLIKKAMKKLREFANIIKEKKETEDLITTMDLFNNTMYCTLVNYSWNSQGKKHGLTKNDLKRK